MLVLFLWLAAEWAALSSGSSASLRGVSGVSGRVAWASGAKGTVLRTVDGGATWKALSVPGGEALDFRDVEAFDANRAILMSAGPGAASRIYATDDGGDQWKLLFENPDTKGFFDSIAFWDRRRGLIAGDAVDGRMTLLRTEDGGASWRKADTVPVANEGEGAFAASGTVVTVRPGGLAWLATGGKGGGRVYRSTDWGRTWHAVQTPLRHDSDSSGIFSIAFRDDHHGVVVGGDYAKPDEDRENIAYTEDGGGTWTAGRARPRGFRSAVAFIDGALLVTGTSGSDISRDGGRTWTPSGDRGYNALSVAEGAVWAAGAGGRIGRYSEHAVCSSLPFCSAFVRLTDSDSNSRSHHSV